MPEETEATQTQIDPLAHEVQSQYDAAFMEKDRLNLHDEWSEYEDYYKNSQNEPEGPDDPASQTNIILPNVESQIADLSMEPLEILVDGWTKADRAHAPKAQKALEWIWDKNKMLPKRYKWESQRLKFGTGIWKVYFDGQGKGIQGMPIIEPVDPANFFPDPKVKSHENLHMADYMIHAVSRPRRYIKRVYGPDAQDITPNMTPSKNPDIYEGQATAFDSIAGDQALVLERWTLEDDGTLRKVVVADDQVLYDSDEDEQRQEEGYYKINKYPFVMAPCYPLEGRVWGMGDIELLKPVQDLINDLDDQIRRNARLLGNIQKVIAVSSGINPNQWTNEAGLNIPARDIDGFRIIQPPEVPAYIQNRRDTARDRETQMISGRTDVVEGRRPGSLRAASAIMALQEAGMKRVVLKKLMSQQALSEVFTLVIDYITEYWTSEQEIGTDVTRFAPEYTSEGEESDETDDIDSDEVLWFRGSDLNEIEIMDKEDEVIPTDEGGVMTKRADFDITVNIGAGFANNKAFLYQAVIEQAQYGIITREEARMILSQVLQWPIIDPHDPVGEFEHKQQQEGEDPRGPDPMEVAAPPGEGGPAAPPVDAPAGAGELPPEMMQQLTAALGGGGGGGPPV